MKAFFSKIIRNEFFKGGVILTLSSVLVNFFNYVFNFLIGRSLGPSGYGEISTLFSYITLLSIPVSVLTTIIIQKIGSTDQDKTAYAKSIENYMYLKMRKYAPYLLLTLLTIPFIPRITNLSLLSSFVIIPLIVLSILTSLYSSLLNGLKLFFAISVISLAITFLKMLGSIATALHWGQIEVVILFLVISSLVGYLLSLFIFKKQSHNNYKSEKSTVIEKRLLHFLLSPQFIITGLSVAAITALNNIDIIYVKKFFSPQDAGLYSSWSLFAKAIFYVLGPLLAVSYVFFTHTKNDKDQNRSFLLSLLALTILGIISFIFYNNFANLIIILLFGAKFSTIAPFLGLASIYGSLYAVIIFINNFFLAGKSKFALILPITLPMYGVALFLIDKKLVNFYLLDNIYAVFLVVAYLIAFSISRK